MTLANAFIIALIAKIGLAAFAALQPQNSSFTWTFGFWLPIAAMLIYIIFGNFKTKESPLEDRLNYGDSCYYLGFLFTIASIILSLYIIGVSKEEFNASDLAIRFAAAMVTTLLGMAIRVYLVTFANKAKKYSRDAVNDVIHGEEPQSGSSQEIYIEAHLKNLEKLNKSLVLNIDATEKLRTNLVSLGARITNDIDVNSKAFQAFTEEMVEQTRIAMQNHQKAFEDSMSECVQLTEEQLSSVVNESTQLTKLFVDESLKKVNNSIEQVTQASQKSIESIDTTVEHSMKAISQQSDLIASQIESGIGNINSVSEKIVQQISGAIVPTNEWQKSLQKVSKEMNGVVENFAMRGNDFANCTEDAIQKVRSLVGALEMGSQTFSTELDKVIKSFRDNIKEIQKCNTECNSIAESKLEALEDKLEELSKLSNNMSNEVHDMNSKLSVKNLFSGLFKK